MFPRTWTIMEAVYDALNLFEPSGLVEAADQYSLEAGALPPDNMAQGVLCVGGQHSPAEQPPPAVILG